LSRPILLCFGYFVLLSVAWAGLQPFLPAALVSIFGVSVALASSALTSFLLGSALGIFVGGVIADRLGRHELVVAVGLSAAALFSLSIGLLPLPVSLLFVCVALAGIASGCTTPSRDLLVRGAAPQGATGKVFGFVYSGLDLGSAVAPPFLGLLLDHHLPRLVFVVVAASLFLAIAAAFAVGHSDAGRRLVSATGTAARRI
jgi:MFS family permease